MRKRVLIVANHRMDRSPAQRFRFEQYLGYLAAHGFDCHLSPLVRNEREDRVFYGQGHYVGKAGVLFNSLRVRMGDWWQAGTYDIVFIHREALMTGHTIFERLLSRGRARVIFDFDDAIWLPAISPGNKALEWLKNPGKTARILSWSDMVFAGNRYLADYAARFCDTVRIVPTTVDTDVFVPGRPVRHADGVVEIGWTGSPSTIEHLIYGLPALRRVRQKFGDRVRFKVIGDATFEDSVLGVKGLPWQKETELRDLSTLDIGIMPLPDTDWTRGKCGFKGLTYMALGIPAVLSPVGVNTEIIDDGVNGYLADSEDAWVAKLSLLIEQPALRSALGAAGRERVVDRYSVLAQRDKYVEYFNEVLDRPRRTARRPGSA
jgi:glycosyltransferase involved in cell wall biosynthesis